MEGTFTNLVAMQEASCEQFANNPLYGTKQGQQHHWISYAEFGQQVAQCRAGLAQLGISAGDAVAFISNNRVEWAVAAYATLGLEAIFVPMYLDQQTKDWQFIINDCTAKIVFTGQQETYHKIQGIKDNLSSVKHIIPLDGESNDSITFQDLLQLGEAHPIPALKKHSQETCCIGYTSGTTGKPKGVMLSHHNFLFEVDSGLAKFNLQPSDRSLSFLPWAHIFGHVTEVHAVIRSGMSAALVNDLTEIVSDLAIVKPTLLYAVPRVYSRIYTSVMEQMLHKPAAIRALFYHGLKCAEKHNHDEKLSAKEAVVLFLAEKLIFSKIIQKFGGRLRIAISGASALSPKVIHFINNIGIAIYEGYGLTETTSAITVNTPGESIIGSVGKPIPGCTIKIDPNNRISEEEGEVICYGGNLMQGYYNRPDKTAEVMTEDDGFRTGDIGKLNKEGYLFITGRVKDQFKLENGKFVTPAPIEEHIKLKSLFSQALIYGANRPYPIALLVIDTGRLKKIAKKKKITGSIDMLLKHPKAKEIISKQLARQVENHKSYEKPKKFILLTEDWDIDNGLLTPTLKIKRKAIEEKFAEKIEALYQEG